MSIQLRWESSTGKLNYDEQISKIHNALMECKRNTVMEVGLFIEAKCPKRDGDMIASFLENLNTSNVQSGVLTLTLGCDEPYAKYVFKMTAANVKHYNTPYEHSGAKAYGKHGPVILDDPSALGNFMEKLIEYTKERLLLNWDRAKYLYLSGRKNQKEVFTVDSSEESEGGEVYYGPGF